MRNDADKPGPHLRGGAIIGPEAEHIVHLLACAICSGERLNDLLSMPFYQPTFEVVLRCTVGAALAECCVEQDVLDDSRCRITQVGATDAGKNASKSKG